MSANKRRKPGEQLSPGPKLALRLLKSPEARPARVSEPDLARALEDLKRRYRE